MKAERVPFAAAALLGLVVTAYPHDARAQASTAAQAHDAGLARVLARPVPLRSGIGSAHEPVTTRAIRAQQFYDQGLAYLHAYVWIEAARSFGEAVRADPALAMAHVGLSYALGELGETAGARTASRRATELAPSATARERFRIELRARQLAAADAPGDAGAASAYRALLARIRTDYWSDVELILLAGHAQASGPQSHGMDGGSASLTYYERAQALAPDYFAVDHYLAHAYENVGRPDAALPHAQRFAAKAPAVPHAHHMYGHVLRQADRMHDAIVEFETADTLHTRFAAAEDIPVDLDWHYRHNLDLLATSYQYTGQMTKAAAAFARAFALPGAGHIGEEQDVNRRAWPLFLLARGRSADALTAARQMQAHLAPVVQALGHILANRALQALGRMNEAAAEGNEALKQMRAIGTAGGTLVPDLELAQGEFLLRSGSPNGGAMLKSGAAKLMADRRPDAWVAAVFLIEAAGRVARERGETALAAELAGLLRAQAPFYPGTHYLSAQLADRRGEAAAARAEYGEALARWGDADRDLPEMADARARLAALASPGRPASRGQRGRGQPGQPGQPSQPSQR